MLYCLFRQWTEDLVMVMQRDTVLIFFLNHSKYTRRQGQKSVQCIICIFTHQISKKVPNAKGGGSNTQPPPLGYAPDQNSVMSQFG